MDEMISLLEAILSELQEMNSKLDDIKGDNPYNSISDVCEKLDELKGDGLYDNISDICNKLDDVRDQISSLETTITLGENY